MVVEDARLMGRAVTMLCGPDHRSIIFEVPPIMVAYDYQGESRLQSEKLKFQLLNRFNFTFLA